jgi:hypothetical protein
MGDHDLSIRPEPRIILIAAIALFVGGVSATRADTYPVINTNASGAGSLAQAILDSNARGGQDTVVFNIPGPGVHLIDLSNATLPHITDSLIVDGYTQPGAHPNTLSVGDDAVILIQLDGGSVANGNNGLTIDGPNCVIRGLSITGFLSAPSPYPYTFGPVGGLGIEVKGTGSVVEGNFIGLNPDGLTATPNYTGIDVHGTEMIQSIIGGTVPASRNVISGNGAGMTIIHPMVVIAGNYIGTDAAGVRPVGNDGGIGLGADDVTIGGTAAGSGNVISGNRGAAIYLGFEVGYHVSVYANRAVIQGNLIGTTVDGDSPLGNGGSGLVLQGSTDCTIGGMDPGAGNVIAFNNGGVVVFGTGNRILSNSIYANNTRGIDLNSGNGNNGQSSPVITSEHVSNSTGALSGTLQSTPNTPFVIQLFADSQSLTTSKQTYLGSSKVMTDSSGNGSFSASFSVSDSNVVFNATATDASGNTSEFSRNPAYLQNISTRGAVGTGDEALIGGFIMGFGQTVVRGIGPSLRPLGLTDALADPTLELHDKTGAQIAFDDNWKDDQSQAERIQQSGLAPTADTESAIAFFGGPFPSSYTAILRGKDDTTGTGLVEAYGLTTGFGNISTRGFVGTGDDVIIGGFILGGGSESPRIVVRALGPSLKAAGVANPLPDPVLELHDGNGSTIKSNDNWADTQRNDLQTVGLAPTDGMESAIVMRLAPGHYTAIVRGKDNVTGVALVEVYRLP